MTAGAGTTEKRGCVAACCDRTARTFVIHPGKVLGIAFVLLAVAGGLILGLDLFAFTEQSNDDFMIKGRAEVQARDAVRLGEQALTADTTSSSTTVRALSERDADFDFFLIVENRVGDDIAGSDAMLRSFQEAIKFVVDSPEYGKICHKPDPNGFCAAPTCPVEFGSWPRSAVDHFSNLTSPTLQPYQTLRPGMTAQQREDVLRFYLDPEPSIRNSTLVAVTAGVEASVPASTPNRQAVVDAAVASQMESQEPTITSAAAGVKGLRSLMYDSRMSASSLKSRFMRCMFPMGGPLAGFSNPNDRELQQRLKWDDHAAYIRETVNKRWFYQSAEERPLRPVVFGTRFLQQQFNEAANTDMIWAIGSVLFVYGYLFFHTGSFFVASVELMQILCSLPVALIVYKLVYGISFFQTLHSLSIFIILGIGCDAVFIFVDAWNQAPVDVFKTDDETLIKRMRFTYNRASRALFVTSTTTFAAFLATGTSEIMPIATFGFFAGTLVLANFLLDLLVLPAVLVIWERNIRPRERACGAACCSSPALGTEETTKTVEDGAAAPEAPAADGAPSKQEDSAASAAPAGTPAPARAGSAREAWTEPKSDSDSKADVDTAEAGQAGASASVSAAPGGPATEGDAIKAQQSLGTVRAAQSLAERIDDGEESQATRWIEQAFRDRWTPIVHRSRYVILVLFTGLLGFTIWAASTLQPLSKQEEWFPTTHWVGQAIAMSTDDFGATENDRKLEVKITWGVSGVDRAGASPYDPTEIGKVVWNAAFEPSDVRSQELTAAVCGEIRRKAIPGSMVASLKECWADSFSTFLAERGAFFPVDLANNTIAGPNATSSLATHCRGETTQKGLFNCAIGRFAVEAGSPGVSMKSRGILGFNTASELRLASVVARTDLAFGQPYATNKPVLDSWNDYIATIDRRGAPFGMDKAIQTAGISWAWMQTERALVTNALQGIGIAVSVALVILIVSTDSIPVGLFSTVTIAGIVLSVLATMVALGWELGTTESISSVVLIGLAVDYSVHLAVGFQEAGERHHDGTPKTRLDRTRTSLTEYGVSIIAGAVTTFGSGVFLRGGTIMFFQKFSVLIMTSIAYSLVWSLLFLPALLMTCAPEDSLCALSALVRCRLRPERPDDESAKGNPARAAVVGGKAASADVTDALKPGSSIVVPPSPAPASPPSEGESPPRDESRQPKSGAAVTPVEPMPEG